MIIFARLFLLAFLLTSLAVATGCGVKGDPVPPVTPVEMGRPKPLYKPDDESNIPPATIRRGSPVSPSDSKDGSDFDEE